MEEIWKDIERYEGLYWISNLGRVKSKRKILKPCINKRTGYIYVCLTKNNKGKVIVIHRLVAKTFLPNPYNLPFINHKDENKQNSRLDNLEWCTAKYNANYGTRNNKLYNKTSFKKGHKPSSCKKVEKYSIDGVLLETYYSIREAGRKNNISASSIYKYCEGQRTCKKYIWKYAIH